MDGGETIDNECVESLVFVFDVAKDAGAICPKDRLLDW